MSGAYVHAAGGELRACRSVTRLRFAGPDLTRASGARKGVAGIPEVVSYIPAHACFARGAEAAMTMYKSEDPQSLASALNGLLAAPEAVARAMAAAFALGRSRFSWELESRKLVDVVKSALCGTPACTAAAVPSCASL
jgi:hypothetical protein